MGVCLRKVLLYFVILTLGILIMGNTAAGAVTLTDVTGHWAEKPIQQLSEQGVIDGYPDGTFLPEKPVTRAEFAKLAAKALGYPQGKNPSFPDTTAHWAKDYIVRTVDQGVMRLFADGNFRPEEELNRGQLAMMLTRIFHVATPEEKYPTNRTPGFTDLGKDHWAFHYVETVRSLGVLPPQIQNEYRPDQPVTRAETAWMLRAVTKLEVTRGKVTQVDPDTGLINIVPAQGDPVLVMITPEALFYRNNLPSNIDAVLNGDEVTAIALSSGDVRYFKSFGQVTRNDLLSRLSTMTKGKLTNDQISAIVSGDWSMLKNDLKGSLYDKLVEMGLTPAEAESIMVQDWNYLDVLSRERLAKALSSRLGITEEFSLALLERDFTKMKEYGKIELATNLLGRLLGATQ